jgi:heavy metal translocating P-type ATPase
MHTITSLLRQYKKLSLLVAIGIIAGIIALSGHPVISQWLISTISLILAGQLAIGMVKTLKGGQFGVDVLAIVAIVSTVAVGQYWATLVITLMLVGGEALENFANLRAKTELTELMKRAPKIAHSVTADGVISDISIDDVQVADMLIVKPGEVIPVDAVLVTGTTTVDESSLTGESMPVDKKPGDSLMSGSINGDETITIKAVSDASASQYAQIVALVSAAADSRAPFVRLADRYAVPFTFIALIIGAVAWWLSGDPSRFAEVLVVATPCPLLIAAPVALISGMSRAARHGIIVKSGAVIEQLASVKTAVFDKTGTLTDGKLAVHTISAIEGIDQDELLSIAASIEQTSAHVLASVIVTHAHSRHVSLRPVTKSNESSGNGIHAVIDGVDYQLGKREYIVKHCTHHGSIPSADRTTVFIARAGEYIGYISFTDTIRSNSREMLERLRELGVRHMAMLTGDNAHTASLVAAEVGIHDVRSECLPVDKLEAIKQFSGRPVMMVGDGVNDAPVLSAADIGIAMGARGATAASESADAVILFDDITKVADAIEISKRTIKIALQSVWVGIIISIGLMLIAATGQIPAIIGAGLQELVDVIVILNALRAHNGHLAGK